MFKLNNRSARFSRPFQIALCCFCICTHCFMFFLLMHSQFVYKFAQIDKRKMVEAKLTVSVVVSRRFGRGRCEIAQKITPLLFSPHDQNARKIYSIVAVDLIVSGICLTIFALPRLPLAHLHVYILSFFYNTNISAAFTHVLCVYYLCQQSVQDTNSYSRCKMVILQTGNSNLKADSNEF